MSSFLRYRKKKMTDEHFATLMMKLTLPPLPAVAQTTRVWHFSPTIFSSRRVTTQHVDLHYVDFHFVYICFVLSQIERVRLCVEKNEAAVYGNSWQLWHQAHWKWAETAETPGLLHMSCLKWLSVNIPGVTQTQNPSMHKRFKHSRPSFNCWWITKQCVEYGSAWAAANVLLREGKKNNIYCKTGEGGRFYALKKDGEWQKGEEKKQREGGKARCLVTEAEGRRGGRRWRKGRKRGGGGVWCGDVFQVQRVSGHDAAAIPPTVLRPGFLWGRGRRVLHVLLNDFCW